MKIAIDIRHLTTPGLSGVGYYTMHLIKELSALAPEAEFLLFATGTKSTLEHLPEFHESNIRIVARQIPNKLFKLLMRLPGGPTMESFLPDNPNIWIFPDSNIIKTRVPYLITAHDLSFEFFKQFFTASQLWRHRISGTKKLMQNAAGILAVSTNTKTDLHHQYGIPNEKITVTPLGVDAHYTPATLPSDQNFLRQYGISTPYILTLSTIEPRKNIESVIEAYDAWRAKTESTKPPKLVIAGGVGWKTSTVSQTLIEATHRDDILLTGYIDEKHKPALLRHAIVLFFPSFYEGFGLPALEAMACGTPVVTTFTGSLPEVVNDAAIMIDPYNVRDLEQAFTMLEENTLRKILSARGIEQAKQFNWRRTAEETWHAIKRTI